MRVLPFAGTNHGQPTMHTSADENLILRGHRGLFVAFIVIILASPFLNYFDDLQWLLSILFTLMMLAAVRTVAGKPNHFWVASAMATLAIVSHFTAIFVHAEWVDSIRLASTCVFLFWIALLLLRDVILRSQEVSKDLLYGAINIYLLVGIAFAFLYGFVEHLQPDSFRGIEDLMAREGSVLPFAYFSFVTMTTLGYGDVAPLTQFGATASYVQAMFGQLYLAILVARLVGMHIARTQEKS